MPQYDVAFAQKLADVSMKLVEQELDTPEARRIVIYLSRLSMELSLKILLERAGRPVSEIKRHKHNLQELLSKIECYEFEMEISPGKYQWCSGANIRSIQVPYDVHLIQMGIIIEAEKYGASKFPNETRYGENVNEIPPEIIAPAASMLVSWVQQHSCQVRCQL